MDREQFLKDRMTGIGGSDAAPALGLSHWKSTLELYLEKRGELPIEIAETEPMRWGKILEPVIRQEYSNVTGRTVVVPELLRHPKYPFVIANVDGIADSTRMFEAKTARSSEGWGEPGTDEVPQSYLLQTQHYLMVTGLKVADVAVLIGGSEFRLYEVPADAELQEMLLAGEADFWQRVQDARPPEPDFNSPRAAAVIRRVYPGTSGEILTATADQQRWRDLLEDSSKRVATYTAAADAARAHLLWEMGDAAVLQFTDGKGFRRKAVARKGYTVEPTEYIDARFINLKE